MSLFKSTKQIELCPECGSALQIKRGKQGLFLGCSAYPECHYLKPLQQNVHIIKTLEEICPECGHFLQLKQGHFGIFIGCSHYPDCHFTVHEQQESVSEFDCPECKQHKLVARTGKAGRIFYGCSGYPECKFTVPSEPIQKECPECGCPLAIVKKGRSKSGFQCVKCKHIFREIDENN